MKVLLLIAALFFSTSVAAEWILVTTDNNDDGPKTVYYADPATLEISGSRVKIREMNDLLDTKNKSYRSVRFLAEYDCKQGLHRAYYFVAHSGNMGQGKTVPYPKEIKAISRQWSEIIPDTVVAALRVFACNEANDRMRYF